MSRLAEYYRQVIGLKSFIIAENELRRIIGSKKFKLMLVIMFLPDIIFLLSSGGTTPVETGVNVSLEEYWREAGANILNFWTGLPAQILVILVVSEMLAGEYENETFKILITKPVKKSELVLGKWLAFVVSMVLMSLLPILLLALLICLMYGGGWDALIVILSYDLWVGELTVVMGLITVGTLTLLFSASLSKSLYAALSSFVVILLYQIFIPQMTWFENPLQYTLSYQLGVVLEETGFVLSPEGRLYDGDIYMTLPAFYILNLLLLTAAIIFTFFKEAK